MEEIFTFFKHLFRILFFLLRQTFQSSIGTDTMGNKIAVFFLKTQ